MTSDGLLTSGRFGSLTMLSAKALRIYAERDLLSAHLVDPTTGYRYYHPDQIATGWLISLLRSAGLSLEEIGQILAVDLDTALARIDQYERDLTAGTTARRSVLERVRSHLRKDSLTMPVITTTLVPDQPVLSILRRLDVRDISEVIGTSLDTLRQHAAEAGLEPAGDPFGIFHAPVDGDSDGPLEVVLPVNDLVDLSGDVRSYRLPGGLLASRSAVGPETEFPGILVLYDEVRSWIDQSGHTAVGPPREIWPDPPAPDAPLRLIIAWPYAPTPAP